MNNEQILQEIREANLSYLVLAQNLIRADRVQAMYRLGLSEEIAEIIAGLTTAQLLKVAARNVLVCRFRFDDELVWSLLTDHSKDAATKQVHASILMASQALEAIA